MTRDKKAQRQAIVEYLPQLTIQTKRERQAIEALSDRDLRIIALEYALKEVRRILMEEPSEIGTAKRIIENAFGEDGLE